MQAKQNVKSVTRLTGFKVGKVEWGVSGGYLHDRNQGSGYFVGSDFYVRF